MDHPASKYRLSYKNDGIIFSPQLFWKGGVDKTLDELVELFDNLFSIFSGDRFVTLEYFKFRNDSIVLQFSYMPTLSPYQRDETPQSYKIAVKIEPITGTLLELDEVVREIIKQKYK